MGPRIDPGAAGFRVLCADRNFNRPVICVGRKRSSVTARCLLVPTVSTIRLNVSSRKLRRSVLLPKGMTLDLIAKSCAY